MTEHRPQNVVGSPDLLISLRRIVGGFVTGATDGVAMGAAMPANQGAWQKAITSR